MYDLILQVTSTNFWDLFPVENLLVMVSPIIVSLVTLGINKFTPKWDGWITVGIVVPIVSGLYALIVNLLGPIVSAIEPSFGAWLAQLIYGLLASFIYEISKQIKQATAPKP